MRAKTGSNTVGPCCHAASRLERSRLGTGFGDIFAPSVAITGNEPEVCATTVRHRIGPPNLLECRDCVRLPDCLELRAARTRRRALRLLKERLATSALSRTCSRR